MTGISILRSLIKIMGMRNSRRRSIMEILILRAYNNHNTSSEGTLNKSISTSLARKKSTTKQVGQGMNMNQILIKGYLDRKVNKLMSSWEKRFCVLTRRQLFCFQEESRVNLISCVNLKLMICSITLEQQRILLYYSQDQQPAIFQASSSEQARKWYQKIKNVISIHARSHKVILKPFAIQLYSNKNLISEQQFLNQVQTGDIILMKTGEDTCCSFQRMITNSQYDHIAIAMKFDQKTVKLFESNTGQGVQMYDWKEYHQKFRIYEKVAFRRLNYSKKKQLHGELMEFAKNAIGGKYSMGAMKLLKLRSHAKEKEFNDDEKRNFFCSELIAKAYKNSGLLQSLKASSRYWPTDFTERGGMILLQQAHFGPQQVVILDRHTRTTT